jgi:hypothetical protein
VRSMIGAVALAACAVLAGSAGAGQEPAADAAAEARAVSQALTAAELAAWGRERSDPGPLILAARMLGELPVRRGEGEAPILTPGALLDEAASLAQGDADVLAAVEIVRAQATRGVQSSPFGRGPIFTVKSLQARESWGFDVNARGGEVLRVAAIGDGDTDIDLSVRDAAGTVVCRDGFGDHYPVCTVSPARPGKMRIDIVNRGGVWTKVQVLSN